MSPVDLNKLNELNIFCKNKGWLFEDLKNRFADKGVIASTEPMPDAKGWICVRSSEVRWIPRLDKVVVQVHDLADHDMALFRHVAGVSFTHPVQHLLWRRAGFSGRYMIRPIGSRAGVRIAAAMPDMPTIGFFCGESPDLKKGANIFEQAVLLARERIKFDCLLIGRGLAQFSHLGLYEERPAGIEDYARIDAFFCASVSPAVPLSVYEAQSAGKPVITTPRWFPGGDWPGVITCESVEGLASAIVDVLKNRKVHFRNSAKSRRSPYTLESWVDENIAFAHDCITRAATI
jgi:glycosyltransferase involved in cell wall biosynthesis